MNNSSDGLLDEIQIFKSNFFVYYVFKRTSFWQTTTVSLILRFWTLFKYLPGNTHNSVAIFSLEVSSALLKLVEYQTFQLAVEKEVTLVKLGECAGLGIGLLYIYTNSSELLVKILSDRRFIVRWSAILW